MMRKFLIGAFLAAAAFAASIGLANAQQITPVVPVQQILSGDVVWMSHGYGSVPTPFADAGLVGGVLHEWDLVPVTGFSFTPGNTVTLLFLNPAGTLGTGTITFPANPSEAQEFCWLSSQTQTAITMTANTGQSIVNGALGSVTAGVAGTLYCWRYIGVTATWYRQS
jgi:hypothetical protein